MPPTSNLQFFCKLEVAFLANKQLLYIPKIKILGSENVRKDMETRLRESQAEENEDLLKKQTKQIEV